MQALCVLGGWPVFAGPMRGKSLALVGAVEYVTNPTVGAWPSGKASGFGPVIPGSNPGAPATYYFPDKECDQRRESAEPFVLGAGCSS